ncbi:MAG: nitroreductase family protein [Lentisphaeria bacterium]|nr:nitroreductase family protein [Lentisphaeria bacterium]
MEFEKLAKYRRTIRFYQNKKVPVADLMKLVDIARFAPSGSNKQPIRYIIIDNDETAHKIFDVTRYAGLITPRRSPVWGVNAPRSFFAVTSAKGGSVVDASAAIQNLLLAAADNGLGCCWIGAFNKEEAKKILSLGDDTDLHFLVAVGYPAESPVYDDVNAGDSVAYYLDDNDLLHVPKIKTEDIVTVK